MIQMNTGNGGQFDDSQYEDPGVTISRQARLLRALTSGAATELSKKPAEELASLMAEADRGLRAILINLDRFQTDYPNGFAAPRNERNDALITEDRDRNLAELEITFETYQKIWGEIGTRGWGYAAEAGKQNPDVKKAMAVSLCMAHEMAKVIESGLETDLAE